jgi:hypothetical protein
MHLLGDVGQVEVGGEGPRELRAGHHVEAGQALDGAFGLGPDQRADLFDEIEQLLAVLADQALAEQRAEPADVGPQRSVGARFRHALAPP